MTAPASSAGAPDALLRRALAEAGTGDGVVLGPGLARDLRARLATRASTPATAPVLLVGTDLASPAGVRWDGSPVPAAARIVAVLTARRPDGSAALVEALPEGDRPLRADRWITDLAVIDVTPEGLIVRELAPGVTARQVQEATTVPLVAAPGLREMAW